MLASEADQRLEVTGIRAISDAHQKEQAEVLSLTGTLALYDNKPFFHVHVALGMRDGSGRGGHVFELTVRPTVELVLTAYPKPVRREIDAETGLPLLNP